MRSQKNMFSWHALLYHMYMYSSYAYRACTRPHTYKSKWTFCEIPIVWWFTPIFHGFHRRKCKIPSKYTIFLKKYDLSGLRRINIWARLQNGLVTDRTAYQAMTCHIYFKAKIVRKLVFPGNFASGPCTCPGRMVSGSASGPTRGRGDCGVETPWESLPIWSPG
jgi:hypothetical protein